MALHAERVRGGGGGEQPVEVLHGVTTAMLLCFDGLAAGAAGQPVAKPFATWTNSA